MSHFKDEILKQLNNLSPRTEVNFSHVRRIYPSDFEDLLLNAFIKRFANCPVCHCSNHDSYLRDFYYSNDPNKSEMRTQLLSLIKVISGFNTLGKEIVVGIPCCSCFEKLRDYRSMRPSPRHPHVQGEGWNELINELQDLFRRREEIEANQIDANELELISDIQISITVLDEQVRDSTPRITPFNKIDYVSSNERDNLWYIKRRTGGDIVHFSRRFSILEGHVITLNLSACKLTSVLKEVQVLNHLQVLDLSDNSIRTIPEWLVDLPQLRELILTNNKIFKIPNTLQDKEGLQYWI